ncbi:EAL domain-containing protein [Rhodobacteraceae bacterium RKSG542]|nr:EAL domain-containing protein [Pseudovibrio flavus]MTI19129.1 EAL domain-containing protein [Pseudovibrio flavus]
MSFYAIDQAAIYLMVKEDAEENSALAQKAIVELQAFKDTKPETGVDREIFTGLALRGSSSIKLSTVDASAQLASDDIERLYKLLEPDMDKLSIVAMAASGNTIAGYSSADVQHSTENSALSDDAQAAMVDALNTGEEQFYSNFSFTNLTIPTFTTVLPFKFDGMPIATLFITAEPSISKAAYIRSLSFATASTFTVVLLLTLCSIYFVWQYLRDRWKTSKTISFLAHNDPLTRLPNRSVFSTHLNQSLRKAQITAANLYVVSIDVDKFKEVNDTHGHAAGDIFLQVIADRLRMVLGNHLVARLAGDEFAAIIDNERNDEAVHALMQRVMSACLAPCIIDGKELGISLSIGIAKATDAAWRASRLLHCSDLALYRSKSSGRSTFTWYDPSMDEDLERRREIERDMRRALKTNGFSVHYQAQVALQTQRLCGFEALLRWNHPEKGMISPEIFIPIAEETGMIEALGEYVLLQACQDAVSWADDTLKVAVNFSPAQFKFGSIEKSVERVLIETGLVPERLEIEITESLLINDTESVIESLKQISAMGVSIAMDDFGTGYSSLSYLSLFPFDKIKIDRSFVQHIGERTQCDAIIAAIVGLGRSLSVVITAEGVETAKQAEQLKEVGCHLVQGYYYGRPSPVNPANPAEHLNGVRKFEAVQHIPESLSA